MMIGVSHTVSQGKTQDFEYLRRLYEELNGGEEPDSLEMPAAPGANGHAAGGPLMLGEA